MNSFIFLPKPEGSEKWLLQPDEYGYNNRNQFVELLRKYYNCPEVILYLANMLEE